ncbi:hypothetical protein KUTeg_014382 [Tegillarca granosa]|uniref:Uncharacterized protein n=1 Tax=Tegillarca granosa TaxID=220873 RepID=A0ABQ9F1T8_TEGGR|nr:hypothetical protein KUTeg_014382 [Tegillarca granosa]
MVVLRRNFIKCVVIGDDDVGKTSMLVSYATNRFPRKHVQPVFDNYAANLSIDGRQCHLQLIDTLEQDTHLDCRKHIFLGTDIFVVCFSCVKPDSFKNVEKKYVPEIRQQMGEDVPFILVSTQTDLREDCSVLHELRRSGSEPISTAEGTKMARRLGAACYVECFPDLEKKVKRVINKAILSVICPKDSSVDVQGCTIL